MERQEEIKKIMLALSEYWNEHPELRLGQIVANASHDKSKNFDPFYMTDKQVYDFLVEKINNESGN